MRNGYGDNCDAVLLGVESQRDIFDRAVYRNDFKHCMRSELGSPDSVRFKCIEKIKELQLQEFEELRKQYEQWLGQSE